jgi:flagellar biosynthesis protein FliR
VTISDTAFIAFFLALVRAGAWIAVAPPFNHRSIPVQARAGLAAAIALAVNPWLSQRVPGTLDTAALTGAVAVQVMAGAGLGFIVRLLLSSVQSAGSMIDVFGGFSLTMAMDPFSQAQSAIWGRFYELLTVVLLFATDGHLLLIRGFVTSFEAAPLRTPSLSHLASTVTSGVTTYFAAALEIGAPLLAALFLAQVVMGMVSRAAPSMNVLALGFPFMILVTLLMASLVVPQLPDAVSSLVDQAVRATSAIAR